MNKDQKINLLRSVATLIDCECVLIINPARKGDDHVGADDIQMITPKFSAILNEYADSLEIKH